MSTTTDLRIYSRQLLQAAQQLDALIDQVAAPALTTDEIAAVAAHSQTLLEGLTATRSGLQSAGKDGLEAALDPAKVRRAMAASIAELPLEPALYALQAVAPLVEKAKAQQSDHGVLSVPLCLAYRHCVEALRPLAAAIDPQDLVQAR
ncbi:MULTISPECIES: hypothetical protein [Sphingobium]|uniref:hypothetical protein n=1 Tax=Sphingobium TaxID=165695 RepID=UPI00159C3C3D|nr:hypothetical protein [Sphingobium sp. 15-1]